MDFFVTGLQYRQRKGSDDVDACEGFLSFAQPPCGQYIYIFYMNLVPKAMVPAMCGKCHMQLYYLAVWSKMLHKVATHTSAMPFQAK